MGRENHTRCSFCGTTEGDEWITGKQGRKIYCSSDCKRVDGLCENILLASALYLIIFYSWSEFGRNLPWYLFPLILLIHTGLILTIAVRGRAARNRIIQRVGFKENH